MISSEKPCWGVLCEDMCAQGYDSKSRHLLPTVAMPYRPIGYYCSVEIFRCRVWGICRILKKMMTGNLYKQFCASSDTILMSNFEMRKKFAEVWFEMEHCIC